MCYNCNNDKKSYIKKMEGQFMITREQLLTIPELKIAGKTALSTPAQFEIYAKSLNAFIDSFPEQAEKMRDAVDEKAYAVFSQIVSNTCTTLSKIYADDMSREYRTKFDKLNKSDDAAVEAFVENLILSVSSLSVDIQMASHAKVSATKPAEAAKQALAGAPKILAVDNAIMFLNTLKKMLQNDHYDVQCLTSGDEALKYLQNNRADMFLLDVEMPAMDGYELARRLRAMGQNAPIIFITANSAREYVDKAAQAGGVGMLMKPLRAHQLLAKLREHV
jgi:CheY-like chemotaxis protein